MEKLDLLEKIYMSDSHTDEVYVGRIKQMGGKNIFLLFSIIERFTTVQ